LGAEVDQNCAPITTAFVAKEKGPFGEVVKAFEVENTPLAAGAERYLMAAVRVGDANEQADWRQKTVKAATGFDTTVYVFRPGLAVLGLRQGADWMPTPLAPVAK
jgi:hypothetical protein